MSSLSRRLRLLTLSLTAAFAVTALFAVARLRTLERSVTGVLSRNYRSIEAAEGMAHAVAALQLAVRDGRCPSAATPREMTMGATAPATAIAATQNARPARRHLCGRK